MPLLADEDLPQGGRRHLVKSANWALELLTNKTARHSKKTRRARVLKNIRRKTSRRK